MATKPRRSKCCRMLVRDIAQRQRRADVPLAGDPRQHRRDARRVPLSRRRSEPAVQRPSSRSCRTATKRRARRHSNARRRSSSRGVDAPARAGISTCIRRSALRSFEQFALLPHTGTPLSRAMFEWLGEARISAVLLHHDEGRIRISHFTAQACGADGVHARTRQGAAVRAERSDAFRRRGRGVASICWRVRRAVDAPAAMPRVFTVVGQITNRASSSNCMVAADVPNFTPFAQGTVLARDGDYRYACVTMKSASCFRTRRSSRVARGVAGGRDDGGDAGFARGWGWGCLHRLMRSGASFCL